MLRLPHRLLENEKKTSKLSENKRNKMFLSNRVALTNEDIQLYQHRAFHYMRLMMRFASNSTQEQQEIATDLVRRVCDEDPGEYSYFDWTEMFNETIQRLELDAQNSGRCYVDYVWYGFGAPIDGVADN